jgi:hypothetical protein
MYCCRCYSSMFPLTRRGCTFCTDSHVRASVAKDYNAHVYVTVVPMLEPRVIGGNDRTTSGSIGQP